MDSKTLDLSQFPKIIPPSPEIVKAKINQRSQGLETIRQLMEHLLNAMQSYLTDLADLDGQQRVIDQEKAELAEIDKQLRYSAHQLEQKQSSLSEQLAFIERRNQELEEKKLVVEALRDDQLKANQEARQELEKKERELANK